MANDKSLILPITKKWFQMILSGEKTEEYREIKPYWKSRFEKHFDMQHNGIVEPWDSRTREIVFRNGYQKNSPQFTAVCSIKEGTGREEWGAVKGEVYYILTIHKIYINEYIKSNTEQPCCVCGKKTNLIEINYQDYFCGDECVGIMDRASVTGGRYVLAQ